MEPPKYKPVENGTLIIEVRDSTFAAALASIGIGFTNPLQPFILLEHADGVRRPLWQFDSQSMDGQIETAPLLEAQADPIAWSEANAQHPLAFALAAIVNARMFHEAEQNSRPLVGFKVKGDRVMYVFKDSRKHRALLARGLKQI